VSVDATDFLNAFGALFIEISEEFESIRVRYWELGTVGDKRSALVAQWAWTKTYSDESLQV